MFGRIADRLVLVPSTEPIDYDEQRPVRIDGELGSIEVMERLPIQSGSPTTETELPAIHPTLLVLKFPGAGGRAERSSGHPTEAWPNHSSVVWTVNPPGYGNSEGRARIRNLGPTAECVIKAAISQFEGTPIIVCGNSLGNLPALYLAANYPNQISGILLRNPPPLREVIIGRHPWWMTLGLARFIAASIPDELDCIENAKRCLARVVMVSSELDRVVPLSFQNLIYDQFESDKRQLVARGIDHAEPIPEDQLPGYADDLRWLVEPIAARCSR